jgi:hypothetical protein
MGLKVKRSRPCTPRTNGKAGLLIQTLREERAHVMGIRRYPADCWFMVITRLLAVALLLAGGTMPAMGVTSRD